MRSPPSILIFLAALLGGCAPVWNLDYDVAMRSARARERDVLVFYKDPLEPTSGQLRDHLQSPSVAPLLEQKVLCVLVPHYPPNRLFVAQFGVDQPPALIVVHFDTTYHALSGLRNVDEIRNFLETAKPPGARPNLDARLPRHPDFQYHNLFDRAREVAQQQNRRLVVLYKWWLHAESNELIHRVSRPEVMRYFRDSVNCILDWDFVPNREIMARYGVTSYPAVIIVEPNGESRLLTGLPSVEQIIKFAVAGSGASPAGATPTEPTTPDS